MEFDGRPPAAPSPDAPLDGGWLSRERVLALVLIAATAGALYLCYRLAVPFLPALTWALTFAIVGRPLHRWIRRLVKNPDAAAALAVGIVALILFGPGLLVAQKVIGEATASIERFEAATRDGSWGEQLESAPYVGPAFAWLRQRLDLGQEIVNGARTLTADLGTFLAGSIAALVQLLLTLFILYYAFRDQHHVVAAARGLMPLTEAETDRLFAGVAATVRATVFGTVMVALLQGVLGGLAFWWLGLPAPLLWGVVMAVLAVIPWLGAFVVWVPAAALLAVRGEWGSAALLTVWGTVVVGCSDNVLYPILVGSKLRLHTLPTFIAIVGGLAVFGAAGVILGPVVLAVTIGLLDVWRQRLATGRSVENAVTPALIVPGAAEPTSAPQPVAQG